MSTIQPSADVTYSNQDIREYYSECHSAYKKRWKREGHQSIHYGYFEDEETTHGEAIPAMKQQIADAVDIGEGDRVLDAGCGVGETATWLAQQRGAEVVGLNISEMQIGLARDMAENRGVEDAVEFRFDDFTEMESIEDGSFDVVWGLESICYAEDKREFLQQAKRALTDDGRIVVADGYLTRPEAELSSVDETDMRMWLDGWKVPNLADIDGFTHDLRSLGFEAVTADDITPRVMRSSKSLYKFSLWGYPLTKLMQLVGFRNQVQTDNVAACYYQYTTLRDRVWAYNIVSGTLSESA